MRATTFSAVQGANLPSSGSDACESGKTVMFAKLYERFRQPIHSYSYRLLCNREDADDVTQQVFLRTYQAWDGLYARDDLSAWLYRLATNFSIDLLRRRRLISRRSPGWHQHKDVSSESRGDEENPHWPPESEGIPDIAEREHIRLALANLPEQYAVVLVLSAAQGVPYQEIATILDISPQAAATRISCAKRMFAEQYQRLSKPYSGEQTD
jgi:RNA polymerase sigma-70 factor, ECF subfamily